MNERVWDAAASASVRRPGHGDPAASAPTMEPGIQRAKLAPPRMPADVIRRADLERRLERAADLPLTLVTARAGFGKTTLLADWAQATTRPVAWLALDPSDSDLFRFVRGLVAAIRSAVPGAAPQAAAMAAGAEPLDPALLAEALGDDLFDLPHELVLVLDDLDAACWTGPAELLSALLRFPPPMLRVVASCRREPAALDLARMRALGLAETIGEADLRFTPEETTRALGGGPDAPVDRVMARADGWPAGVRALAREGADAPRPASVRAYVAEDMLAGLPSQSAAFLRRIAVAERVTPALAAELAGDAADTPAAAERLLVEASSRGVLLDRQGDGPWWALNPLVRDELLALLRAAEGEDAVRALHARAARWLADAGEEIPAVDQALLAGEADVAAGLIERNIIGWLSGTSEAALEWVDRLPDAVVRQSAPLLIARAAVQVFHANPARAASSLDAAERLLDAELGRMDVGLAEALRWEIVYLRAGIGNFGVGPRVSPDLMRGLMERAEGASLFTQGVGPGMWALDMQVLGRWEEAYPVLEARAGAVDPDLPVLAFEATWPVAALHLRNADVAAFLPWLERTALVAKPGGHLRRLQWLANLRTGWLLESGDPDAALAVGEAALRDAPGIVVFPRHEVLLRQARILLEASRVGDARRVAADARRWLEGSGAVELLSGLAALDAEIALATGNLAAAWRWADTTRPTFAPDPMRMTDHAAEVQARIWLARNRPGDAAAAVAALEALRDMEIATHHRLGLARTLPLLAVARAAAGDPDGADATMREALAVEPGALTRRFTSLGEPARALLAPIAAGDGRLAPRAARLLAGWPEPPAAALEAPAPPHAHAHATAVGVRLTPRQRAILGLMARWRTDKEIAAELGLSVYTVNEHVGNIMRKLDVGDRRSAVSAALGAGLLAPEDVSPGG